MPFEKIEPIPISTQAVDQIIAAIRSGDFVSGDRMPPEREMAKMLGISRSSLREALAVLATLGVLEVRPGAGTFVQADIISKELLTKATELLSTARNPLHALELRRLLEPGIAGLAAARAEPDEQERLARLLRQMETLARADEPLGLADRDFHLTIAAAAKNPFVEYAVRMAIENWFHQPAAWNEVMETILRVSGRTQKYFDQHVEIVEAIQTQDAARARQAMQQHIETVHGEFLRYRHASESTP